MAGRRRFRRVKEQTPATRRTIRTAWEESKSGRICFLRGLLAVLLFRL